MLSLSRKAHALVVFSTLLLLSSQWELLDGAPTIYRILARVNTACTTCQARCEIWRNAPPKAHCDGTATEASQLSTLCSLASRLRFRHPEVYIIPIEILKAVYFHCYFVPEVIDLLSMVLGSIVINIIFPLTLSVSWQCSPWLLVSTQSLCYTWSLHNSWSPCNPSFTWHPIPFSEPLISYWLHTR